MLRSYFIVLLVFIGTWRLDGGGDTAEKQAELNRVLRKHADASALFAASLSRYGNHPGAVDFFTEALCLLPGDERWATRRAEYTRRLAGALEDLGKVNDLDVEDRRYLMEAAAEFTKEPPKKPPVGPVGLHPLRLQTILIPKIEFREIPFLEALGQIEQWSREFDPDGMGLEIEIEEDIKLAPDLRKATITLRLSQVALAEALRYTCSLAQMRYTIEEQSVRVERISYPLTDLPNFFMPVDGSAFSPVSGNVKGHFEERGFSFPQGGGAVYDHEKRELFVKTLESQIPGIVLWMRREGTLQDEEDVYRRGLARIARADAYRMDNLTAASEDRYREALGYFVWLEKKREDFKTYEVSDAIKILRDPASRSHP